MYLLTERSTNITSPTWPESFPNNIPHLTTIFSGVSIFNSLKKESFQKYCLVHPLRFAAILLGHTHKFFSSCWPSKWVFRLMNLIKKVHVHFIVLFLVRIENEY